MGRRSRVIGVVLAALALTLVLPASARAARLASVVGGFDSPVFVATNNRDPGGTLYIVEQEGQIWRWRRGQGRTLFLDIRNLVNNAGNEQGLFTIEFDGAYGTNRRVYVNYTRGDGDVVVARYRANAAFTRVVESTRRQLLRVEHSGADNHNGGTLAWGPNGRLYFSVGDGGGGCDSGGNAQNLRSRLGKLLSVNPRNLGAGWRIDGYGLRNPWRFSFDRATGRLYIGDVGQNAIEEVDTRRALSLGGRRENYGWDVYEGRTDSASSSGCAHGSLKGDGQLIWPVAQYGHSAGRCSVTGGYAYRGRVLDWLRGSYVFADFCTGEIWRLKVDNRGRRVLGRRLILDSSLLISSFGEGRGGELYVVDRGGGIYKLVRS
jgi:glucose/sorbosone dehydrogenase